MFVQLPRQARGLELGLGHHLLFILYISSDGSGKTGLDAFAVSICDKYQTFVNWSSYYLHSFSFVYKIFSLDICI